MNDPLLAFIYSNSHQPLYHSPWADPENSVRGMCVCVWGGGGLTTVFLVINLAYETPLRSKWTHIGSNSYSRGSVPVFLRRKPIATCDFSGRSGPLSLTLDQRMQPTVVNLQKPT